MVLLRQLLVSSNDSKREAKYYTNENNKRAESENKVQNEEINKEHPYV